MERILYWFLILIILSTLLTGCWSRQELNELAITLAVGVDKYDDQYKVTAQIVNPGEVASNKSGGNSPISTYTSYGDTVHTAIRSMTTKSPRKIYAAHLRLFVIGEELAKEEGIGKVLDLISRDPEVRTDFFIIVTKDTKAEQVLKILSIPLEKIPANKIFESLRTSEKAWAATSTITLDELITDLISDGKNPLITGLQINGNPKSAETMDDLRRTSSPTVLNFVGLAAFKKDKLVGWLNEKESKGANYIRDKVNDTIIEVKCPNEGLIGIKLIRSKADVTSSVKDQKPMVTVSVEGESVISDVECTDINLTKNTTIRDLEKRVEEEIKGEIEAAIEKAHEYKTDIFGFGEVVHEENPKYWRGNKKNWDEEFVNLPVNLNVDIKIRRIGTVGNSFLRELKE